MYRPFLIAETVGLGNFELYDMNLYHRRQQSHPTEINSQYRESDVHSSSATQSRIDSQRMIATPNQKPTPNQRQCMMNEQTWVDLNLEDLACFEVVSEQFKPWGITFQNTIALHPSNSFYPPRSGRIVLMGAPKGGWIEINFEQPIGSFSCYVTASQKTVLSAYNGYNQVLDQDELPEANLADSSSSLSPNAHLQVTHPNIHRITLYAFDGQLTLDDIRIIF